MKLVKVLSVLWVLKEMLSLFEPMKNQRKQSTVPFALSMLGLHQASLARCPASVPPT